MRVLDNAYDMGIKVFMCTTHDRVGEVADLVRANPTRYADFQFYPCMPYAHKYANSVGEVGCSTPSKVRCPARPDGNPDPGRHVARGTQDIYRLMKMLVDAEMKRFVGLKTPRSSLQNVVTDLLLGLKLNDVFPALRGQSASKYDAEAGFITMNMPLLVDVLEEGGLENPIVCANINKIGFRMSGGIDAYRDLLRDRAPGRSPCRCSPRARSRPGRPSSGSCGLEGLRFDRVRRLVAGQHPPEQGAHRALLGTPARRIDVRWTATGLT